MTLADAHLHLFKSGYAGVRGNSPAGGDELTVYEGLRQKCGIEIGLVVGYEGESRYAGNNKDILSWSHTHHWMAPLCFVPVRSRPDAGRLRELLNQGYAGVSLYLMDADAGRDFADWPSASLQMLAKRRALVSFNATPPAIAALSPAVGGLEGAAILFSHLGLPGRVDTPLRPNEVRERLASLLRLAEYEHVMVKLSGLYSICDWGDDEHPYSRAQPLIAALLESLGPNRIVWGSDFSPALDFASFQSTTDMRALSGLTPAEADAVMGGTLLRLIDAQRTMT